MKHDISYRAIRWHCGMERRRIPMVADKSIKEAGDPVPFTTGAGRPDPGKSEAAPKAPDGLFGLPNWMFQAFVRYVLFLRQRLALLEQAHQFSGDVVNLGLDAVLFTCLAFARCCVVRRVEGRLDRLDPQVKRVGG